MKEYNVSVIEGPEHRAPLTATVPQALELSREHGLTLRLSDEVGFDRFTTYPDFTWKVH